MVSGAAMQAPDDALRHSGRLDAVFAVWRQAGAGAHPAAGRGVTVAAPQMSDQLRAVAYAWNARRMAQRAVPQDPADITDPADQPSLPPI